MRIDVAASAMASEPSLLPASAVTQSWWEHYGPIGFVAMLAISSLVLLVKYYLGEKRERDKREEAERAEREKRTEAQRAALQTMIDNQQRSLDTLNARMLELVQASHESTMSLLNQQRDEHEKRFQALLERHMTTADKSTEKVMELATVVSKTIDALSRKLGSGG